MYILLVLWAAPIHILLCCWVLTILLKGGATCALFPVISGALTFRKYSIYWYLWNQQCSGNWTHLNHENNKKNHKRISIQYFRQPSREISLPNTEISPFISTWLQTSKSILTFGHLNETSVVFCRILVLQERRVFNETCLLWCALFWGLRPGHGQGARQKPEWDGSQQGDDPSYEVAQPPGPHPASVCWGDGDTFCVGCTDDEM